MQKSFNIENNKEQNGDTEVEAEEEDEAEDDDDDDVIAEEEEEEEDDSGDGMSGEQVRVSNNIATSLAV